MAGSVEERLDRIREELDRLEESGDDGAVADLARREMPWLVDRLDRVVRELDRGGINRLLIAADELATCTNEQMLAERVRVQAENLRETLDLEPTEEWVL